MQENRDRYSSCAWIEGGISFHPESLNFCAISHHSAGQPAIGEFKGGAIPLDMVLAQRERFRRVNSSPSGHPECRGCRQLRQNYWVSRPFHFDHIAINNGISCNLKCCYCYLQKQISGYLHNNFAPYPLRPIFDDLVSRKLLSPSAVVDWGGGGEPTLNPEFDELIGFLLHRVAQIYVHTNATILAPSLTNSGLLRNKLHVICSVDAGSPETFVKIKGRNFYDKVWHNLSEYARAKIALTLKYIVTPFNRNPSEISTFIQRGSEIGARCLIVDIDRFHPVPDRETMDAIIFFLKHAREKSVNVEYGYLGDFSKPENKILERIDMEMTSRIRLARKKYRDYGYKCNRIRLPWLKDKPKMQFRSLGRTGLKVSVVGFGTAQLRLLPEEDALKTLQRGIELGVNIIHTAPDYEGALDIVARAIERTKKKVIVACQGYDIHGNSDDRVTHFESIFESACRTLKTRRLELFGIAAIENREALGENVWKKNGMVEFLLKKKEEKRLGSIFCTTHGSPEYIRSLFLTDIFDAIMIPYNVLGFHLLSRNGEHGGGFENLEGNARQVIPLCQEKNIGLMVMKPYAGGLLVRGKAFPARFVRPRRWPEICPSEALRHILDIPGVSCVMPGTASVEEAQENALSGWGKVSLDEHQAERVNLQAEGLRQQICRRCGKCEIACSKSLPISWLFRSAFLYLYPSDTFEDWPEVEYFVLHSGKDAPCDSCLDKTCICPYGIDIPGQLKQVHVQMIDLLHRGLAVSSRRTAAHGDENFGAKVLIHDIPEEMRPKESYRCYLYLENCGIQSWFTDQNPHKAKVRLHVQAGPEAQILNLRHDVNGGGRVHFAFYLRAPDRPGDLLLTCRLIIENSAANPPEIVIFNRRIPVITTMMDSHPETSGNRPLDSFDCTVDYQSDSPLFVPTDNTMGLRRYGVSWTHHNLPLAWEAGLFYQVYIQVENMGTHTWLVDDPKGKNVLLALYVDGDLSHMEILPSVTRPGEGVLLTFPFKLPETDRDQWQLKFSFVEHEVAWFEKEGVDPLEVTIQKKTILKKETKRALMISQNSNSAFYIPSAYVITSRSGRLYPKFIQYARGCRLTDMEGNQWIDYIMGWGSALLGYAPSEIQSAIETAMGSGAIISLPHIAEIRVTKELCDLIPCAEMVLFGKNGSDVCTAAIRMAKLHTGKQKILFSGYHGWHDWYADSVSPDLNKLTENPKAFRFPINDMDAFSELIRLHRGNIAAVILEPAAQAESIEGPVREADSEFLRALAEVCREEKIVLIFDEIITGFRYLKGNVQVATGVVPDMACFGKALSGGMPLSAVVGRQAIMSHTLPKAFYHPTFKGEVYSFAAALEALKLYRRIDVPRRIHKFGSALMRKINRASKKIGIKGRMIGQPYRMVYSFTDASPDLRCLKRTLLQQELLKNGIITFNGYLLPSISHGETELATTLSAYKKAFTHVNQTIRDGSFAKELEIPLLR